MWGPRNIEPILPKEYFSLISLQDYSRAISHCWNMRSKLVYWPQFLSPMSSSWALICEVPIILVTQEVIHTKGVNLQHKYCYIEYTLNSNFQFTVLYQTKTKKRYKDKQELHPSCLKFLTFGSFPTQLQQERHHYPKWDSNTSSSPTPQSLRGQTLA